MSRQRQRHEPANRTSEPSTGWQKVPRPLSADEKDARSLSAVRAIRQRHETEDVLLSAEPTIAEHPSPPPLSRADNIPTCQAELVEGKGVPCRSRHQIYYSPAAFCFRPYSRELMQVPFSAESPWRMLRRIVTFAKAARVGWTTSAPLCAASLHKPATQTEVTANWFCSNKWQPSIHGCDEMSFDIYCGDDESRCDEGLTCEYTHCNVRDMIDTELVRRREVKNREMFELLVGLSGDDRRRYNTCGKSLKDANSRCGQWCSDPSFFSCPDGEDCFTDTNCYAVDGAEPTTSPSTPLPSGSPSTPLPSGSPSTYFPSISPVEPPSESPTTRAPTEHDDPIQYRFCANEYGVIECKAENYCPSGKCPHGQICVSHAETYTDSKPDAKTPRKSAASPTRKPSRTEGVVFLDGDVTVDAEDNYWCGATQLAAIKNCGTTNFYCVRGLCPFGWSCHHVENEACGADLATQTNGPFVEINRPSREPTKRPVSAPPTKNVPYSTSQSEKYEDSGFTKPLPGRKNKAHESKNGDQPKPFTHAGSRPQSYEELEPQSSPNKVLASNKGKRPAGCEAGWHTTADCKSYWECDAYGKKSKSFSCGQGNAFDLTYNMCIPEELLDKDKCQFKQTQSHGEENTHQLNSTTDDLEVLLEFSQGAEDGEDSHVIEAMTEIMKGSQPSRQEDSVLEVSLTSESRSQAPAASPSISDGAGISRWDEEVQWPDQEDGEHNLCVVHNEEFKPSTYEESEACTTIMLSLFSLACWACWGSLCSCWLDEHGLLGWELVVMGLAYAVKEFIPNWSASDTVGILNSPDNLMGVLMCKCPPSGRFTLYR
ncbi:hypothetical protein THAOC_07923 [Thalassiosira oceanica]|uniref:Chitin-binding type-2 domain-containing protein n=1 Tax=Thalassiosira oceanica TaxID=159749 RepID=K0TBC2_THAOC|nr:hypothetical protein THAOC_07923 [Thalassiosira oceanica]|eukprot:EJK70696.1 hypothetical protein THAOC_07923 [Thalassiosira oceanica]